MLFWFRLLIWQCIQEKKRYTEKAVELKEKYQKALENPNESDKTVSSWFLFLAGIVDVLWDHMIKLK